MVDFKRRFGAFLWSFVHATNGLRLSLRERNARVQAAAGLVAVALGAALGLSRVEWAVLTLTIALVLALETVNSAIEALVDLVTLDYHPLAKRAKDLAAGAVWLAALAAVVVGLLLFLPRLWAVLVG